MPRMRTPAGVLAIIKKDDPDTEVTLYFIRRIIKSGKIPVVTIGTKKLVDADVLIQYIAEGNGLEDEEPQSQGIRKVAV